MALQTNVLENGEWVTRTLEARDLFRQTTSPQQTRPKRKPQTPPTYGILTRTVIDSPVFHWVLPAQLRSTSHNDVAFIGDNFIQICELAHDGNLQEVARKQDFGSRIRNACVIGLPSYDRGNTNGCEVKIEDEDVDMDMLGAGNPNRNVLPPQLLVLVLECGDLLFLHLERDASSRPTFVSHIERIPDSRLILPGYHLTVDPSSRFLTLACSEDHFQVWKLESMETLRSQYARGLPLSPILGRPHPRAVRGVIHKIEFLSPGPGSHELIILTLIIVNNGGSRIHRYEWELEDDIDATLKGENKGWKLHSDIEMPLLVIPSTVRESFLLVTESSQAFWATLENGHFGYEEADIGEHDETDLHIGGTAPLWTAWSRPWRLPEYHLDKDTIWLAREDGILNYLEITAGDGLLTNVIMGEVECKIDTAFACLYDPYADILITSGDSGPGAIWRSEPRQPPKKIGTIPNWSPTIDITSTYAESSDTKSTRTKSRGNQESALHLRPDRLFACSGRGKTGSIAEFRHGLEAKIGAEMDCRSPIKHCWQVSRPDAVANGTFPLLASYPDKSEVFYIEENFDITSMPQDAVPYDLSSSTLVVQELEAGRLVQVTNESLTVVASQDSKRYHPNDLSPEATATISQAALWQDTVALAFYTGTSFHVKTWEVVGLELTPGSVHEIEGEVTCLALSRLGGQKVLFAAIWNRERPYLALYSTSSPGQQETFQITIDLSTLYLGSSDGTDHSSSLSPNEAITSIVTLGEIQGCSVIVLGTRSGEVVTITMETNNPQAFQGRCDRFGYSAAHVSPMSQGSEAPSVLVCCDSSVFLLANFSTRKKSGFSKKHRIWATNVDAVAGFSPEINAVCRMPYSLSQGIDRPTLALVNGSTIYISELHASPRPVLRHLPVLGTPNKILYHSRLDVLIIGVLQDGRPSLRFIDPTTGADLSFPTDSSGNQVEHITGLGKWGTQIAALAHWNYEKDGRTWSYIVVSVRSQENTGQVLIVTAGKDDSRVSENGPYRIRFSTKLKRSAYPKPVYSIATEAQGLILCSGDTAHYEILDLEQKKLRKVKEHRLSSPAGWMEVVDNKLHAVTINHSLEIIDFLSQPDNEAMIRLYSDDRAKQSVHCIQAVDISATHGLQPITLVSDYYCGLWGMWAPPQGERPLRTIFQAELQASVRRFTRARARPQWSALDRQTKYGYIRSSVNSADVLGLSIDGSLRHFTILQAEAWRFLRFIQNLASRSTDICPHSPTALAPGDEDEDSQDVLMDMGWEPEPQTLPVLNMQVDGDVLQRCLDKQALEHLVSEHAVRFRELLDALDGGEHTDNFKEFGQMSDYLDLAYDVLEYFLEPVL